jgi:hypothetical protein
MVERVGVWTHPPSVLRIWGLVQSVVSALACVDTCSRLNSGLEGLLTCIVGQSYDRTSKVGNSVLLISSISGDKNVNMHAVMQWVPRLAYMYVAASHCVCCRPWFVFFCVPIIFFHVLHLPSSTIANKTNQKSGGENYDSCFLLIASFYVVKAAIRTKYFLIIS